MWMVNSEPRIFRVLRGYLTLIDRSLSLPVISSFLALSSSACLVDLVAGGRRYRGEQADRHDRET